MREAIAGTGLWQDTADVPEALAQTLDAAEGFADVADLIRSPEVRRLVASGNGASYYVAHALWLASLHGAAAVEVLGIPAGLLCGRRFAWREGDLLLAVSSSGEFRDLIEAVEDPRRPPLPYAAITRYPEATLPRGAGARAVIRVPRQRAVTHTADFCGGTTTALAIWADVCGDADLAAAVQRLPETVARAVELADELPEAAAPDAVVSYGTGPAWAASLETALLVKEVAEIPAEGLETREAATSAMTAAGPGQLFVAHPIAAESLVEETERLVQSRGAAVARIPGGDLDDARVSALSTFPGAVALAIQLAGATGTNVDRPEWIDLYYTTARRS